VAGGTRIASARSPCFSSGAMLSPWTLTHISQRRASSPNPAKATPATTPAQVSVTAARSPRRRVSGPQSPPEVITGGTTPAVRLADSTTSQAGRRAEAVTGPVARGEVHAALPAGRAVAG